MTIGVIGAGRIGRAIARVVSNAGRQAVLSNSRGPASLATVVSQFGANVSAGTVAQAAAAAIVALAVPWNRVAQAVSGLPAWEGRIVIDATNPVAEPGFRLTELGGRPSSEVVAALVPGARVVKAFNTLAADLLAADPHQAGGRRVLFFSGDDEDAKHEVGRLLEDAGFAGIDLGTLDRGGRLQQFPGGPLPALNLIRL